MSDNRYTQRTIVKHTLTSGLLDAPRELRVYLPPGYNELSSYPVIYGQDGEDLFNYGRIATHMNRLILDENVQPAIIVGIEVDKSKRTSEYAPDGSRYAAYAQFVATELVPYIEARYPARPDVTERILVGDSLGGTVSLHLALDYPYLFQNVIALSGAFLSTTHERLARESSLSWLRLWQLIGTDEREVKTERGTFDFLELNRTAREWFERRNVQLTYVEKPGKHLWGFWQQELPEALKAFLG
ncbi:alpha/beta hydrolase [Paenibacillus thermoaerophilus]|uniref:Alpha/beta hydrolase n=1 Tax=Paenibacillus thermoaerophilus TaxID=1215385 RepID=A0ABW2V9H4_9BACL|nr:alpha/beta hydrolase-fold protein [Paenibacillus thermoaerophilus]TMV17897.1 esterase family protein [Paenibacillus thermoaerophilus]